ncbi:hypothetical protein H0H81_001445, partial [Sphagnurus paluster]
KNRNSQGAENNPSSDSDTGHYEYGRMLCRQGDLFLKVDSVVNFGLRYETTQSNDDKPLSKQDKRYLASWRILCKLIPGFEKHMLSLGGDRKQRKSICSDIMAGMNKARSDDTSAFKTRITSYMLLGAPNAAVTPPLSSDGTKQDRGFHHLQTARLLCPIKYVATAETFTKIRNGELKVTDAMLPRYLYPDDQEYDPKDMSEGIFRGHIMERALRHLLQGPSLALQAPGTSRGKSGNAAIGGLYSVTPQTIAYVAVQV